MARNPSNPAPASESILGTGWGFPPEFVRENGGVRMASGEEDIAESLRILFGTARGERFLVPDYGLEMRDLVFEAMSTTMRTLLADRIQRAIAIHEPRIDVVSVGVDRLASEQGTVLVSIDYVVRSTNSRYNLVFPFYLSDGNEARAAVSAPKAGGG